MDRSSTRTTRNTAGRTSPTEVTPVAATDAAASAASADRRRNRSSDPLVALHYQLTQTRHEGRFEAVVVADDSGVVVAGAGAWATCEELAAYAPLFARRAWTEPGVSSSSRLTTMQSDVDVQSVDVDGHTVLLCARGGRRGEDSLGRAARGVARILARAA
jgi:hypothetical protein